MRLAQAAPSKPLTPQRQKMMDCGGKWQDEKAKTGVKGRTAYRKFMSDCLKKAPAYADAGYRRRSTVRHEPPAASTGLRGTCFQKIPRASARGRGCESVGK